MRSPLRFLISILLVAILAVASTFLFREFPAQADENVPVPLVPTIAYSNGEQQLLAPDWSEITWSSLPPIQEPGWIKIPPRLISKLGYDASRVWQAGQTPDSFVMLGDIAAAMHPEVFNLKDISSLTTLAIENLHLKDFELINWQTPASLVKAIPNIRSFPVNQIEPIRDLFLKAGIPLDLNTSVVQALQRYIEIAQLPLKQLDLAKYPLKSIPGLTSTPLKKFTNWQQTFVNRVPGLNQVPLNQFPQSILGGINQVAIVDIPWSSAERGDPKVSAKYFVSGSVNKRNRTVPVACEAGKPCAYLELSDPIGNGGLLNGKRWASGKIQKVKGGYGILAKINNGWEPAGKLVFGPAFKVVLTDIDEATGTANFSLYLRFCSHGLIDLGCTPYFIGPISWLPVREKGVLIVAGTAAPSVKIPSMYQAQIAALRQQYEPQVTDANSFDNCASEVSGDAVNRAITAVPSGMRSYANKTVPLVLAAAKKHGVTDPAQVAYILSTVQTETTMGANLFEGATRNKSAPGSVYYGRGLVQLTHKDNYRKASSIVGVDLVKYPDKAANPELSAKILVVGMRDGIFTGRRLSDFIKNGRADFVGARQIVNDGDKAVTMSQDAQRYLAAIKDTNIANLKDTGGTCSSQVVASGSVQQRIYQAANQSYGMSSRSGPGGGNVACAWAVNRVLNKAGIPTIGSNPNLVFSVHDALEAGRGQEIANRSQAVAGDLVLALGSGSKQHIGICQNNGCTKVISNSSSKASFSWISDTDFGGYYGVPSKIYRVVK